MMRKKGIERKVKIAFLIKEGKRGHREGKGRGKKEQKQGMSCTSTNLLFISKMHQFF